MGSGHNAVRVFLVGISVSAAMYLGAVNSASYLVQRDCSVD
ncbi:hypothetical protein ACP70R_010939 [Stipagrostis hirtigluma subsp. patula]